MVRWRGRALCARGIPVLALALTLEGCRPPVLRQGRPEELRSGPFAFLQDGRTTREEALLGLGTPSWRMDGDRVLAFAYTRPGGEVWVRCARVWSYRPTSGPNAPVSSQPVHSLVLVFDGGGILARHSLVVSE